MKRKKCKEITYISIYSIYKKQKRNNTFERLKGFFFYFFFLATIVTARAAATAAAAAVPSLSVMDQLVGF